MKMILIGMEITYRRNTILCEWYRTLTRVQKATKIWLIGLSLANERFLNSQIPN